MIILEKDRHEAEILHFLKLINFITIGFLDKEFNNESTNFISLGDWFHSSHPTPEEIDEEMRFLSNSKMKFFSTCRES